MVNSRFTLTKNMP